MRARMPGAGLMGFEGGGIPLYMEEVDGPPVLKYYDGPVSEDNPIFVLERQIAENPAACAADLERFDAATRAQRFHRPRC